LIAGHGLRWWPTGLEFSQQTTDYLTQLLWYLGPVFVYCILFSAMAGYYLCYWPGKRPLRRVIWLVCAPAVLGLGLVFTRVLYLSAAPASVLESASSVIGNKSRWAEALLWKPPGGFHFALLGLILIGVFASRMVLGIANLPIVLPNARVSQKNSGAWQRLQILIFLLVGPLFLAYVFVPLVGTQVLLLFSSRVSPYWFRSLVLTLASLAAYGVLLGFMRREERQITLDSIRRFGLNHVLLATVFPVGINVVISLSQYLPTRMHWAAHDFGRFGPPRFETYFSWPNPWLFLLFFAALCEELSFRGLLQPRFIQRYGLYRGIFLVGIVWAAFHFFF
jgi:membrane protease YdiL (CAAX protease family)